MREDKKDFFVAQGVALLIRSLASCQRWAALQMACELQTSLKFIQVPKKNWIFGVSLPVSSQLILKYAYTLDILIPHIVHMTYFDYTLSILQNFEKTI